jgi:hypothetical protein
MRGAAIAAFAAAMTCVTPAFASTVIYNNFSANPSNAAYPYTPTATGYGVQWSQAITWGGGGGPVAAFGEQMAMRFTVEAGSDIPLQSISMAMYKWPSGVSWDVAGDPFPTNHDNLTIELVGGTPALPDPGDVIETLAVNPSITEDSTSFLTLHSASHPILQNGQTYWVIAEPTAISTTDSSADSVYLWVANVSGAQFHYTTNEYNPFMAPPQWQGFFNQSAFFDAPTLKVLGGSAPVPEPSTWLLSILGFGLLGAALRRRRGGLSPARSTKDEFAPRTLAAAA